MNGSMYSIYKEKIIKTKKTDSISMCTQGENPTKKLIQIGFLVSDMCWLKVCMDVA